MIEQQNESTWHSGYEATGRSTENECVAGDCNMNGFSYELQAMGGGLNEAVDIGMGSYGKCSPQGGGEG